MSSLDKSVVATIKFLWVPALVYLSVFRETGVLLATGIVLVIQSLLNYLITICNWHLGNKFINHSEVKTVLPPQYPSPIPYIGSALSFVWDNAKFLSQATRYEGRLTSSRISFLGFEIFVFQDRQAIAKIWKQSALASPISITVYTLKYFFEVPEDVLSVYRADNSGPFQKPHKGTHIVPKARVDHITHHGFLQALSGPGWLPTAKRYMKALNSRLEGQGFSEEWTEVEDMSKFFKEVIGSALIESLYGPTMLRLSPTFMRNLWAFDAGIPWLARGIPSFMKPSIYKPRQAAVGQLRRWYLFARNNFDESCISSDGDGDPYWGSWLMRYRQEKLLAAEKHNDDVLSKLDLGLAWGLVGNTTPCSMLLTFHVFKDPKLLDRVRNEIQMSFGNQKLLDINPSKLIKQPLLSSAYAEILRLYIKGYFMVTSAHADVQLGPWNLPKGRIALLNSGISQMDESFWNTRGGQYPVSSFWADRFLIDPSDPQSGPVASGTDQTRDKIQSGTGVGEKTSIDNDPYFSVKGTEGSWFPYGGGHSICPGRLLAKNAALFAVLALAHGYDLEPLVDKIEQNTWRFGLGVGEIKHTIPFRIRKKII